MIEAVMFFALGFLSAGIVALIVGPPLWRRAVRLAKRSIERGLPMNRAEIQAEKDQIRATFAVTARRLESRIEQLESDAAAQLVDINRKREVITHLTAQGSLSAEDIIALEKRSAELEHILIDRDAAIVKSAADLTKAQALAAEQKTQLAAAQSSIEALMAERQMQRMEIVARDTELDNLRDTVAAEKTGATSSEVERAGLEAEMSSIRTNLAIERLKMEQEIERQREIEAARQALIATLNQRAAEMTEVRAELAKAGNKIDELSLRLVESETAGMGALAIEEARADMERRLAELGTENARLAAELQVLRQAPAAINEQESALLRGKLIEFGTAIARLVPQKDSPGVVLSLPAPLSEDVPAGDTASGSLAERIRALQHASGGF